MFQDRILRLVGRDDDSDRIQVKPFWRPDPLAEQIEQEREIEDELLGLADVLDDGDSARDAMLAIAELMRARRVAHELALA